MKNRTKSIDSIRKSPKKLKKPTNEEQWVEIRQQFINNNRENDLNFRKLKKHIQRSYLKTFYLMWFFFYLALGLVSAFIHNYFLTITTFALALLNFGFLINETKRYDYEW